MKRNKLGPDDGLAYEQFFGLDKYFYENFQHNYFLNRLEEIGVKIQYTEEVCNFFNRKEVSFDNNKLRFVTEFSNSEDISKAAKIELLQLHDHCLETFMRMFIARAAISGCDWIELSRWNSSKYHTALDRIKNSKFSWLAKDRLSDDMTVQYALTGLEGVQKEITPKVINNWKEWISYAAESLGQIKAYNAYKHGFSLLTSSGGFSIIREDGDKVGREGDYLCYLQKKENSDRYTWVKTTEFLTISRICLEIFVFGNFVLDMGIVGKMQHGVHCEEERWYPNDEFTIEKAYSFEGDTVYDFFQNCLSSVSESLLYYSTTKDHSVAESKTRSV